jgi:hypothetical protein
MYDPELYTEQIQPKGTVAVASNGVSIEVAHGQITVVGDFNYLFLTVTGRQFLAEVMDVVSRHLDREYMASPSEPKKGEPKKKQPPKKRTGVKKDA